MPAPTRTEIHDDPATPFWVRSIIEELAWVDPVDALNALEVVADAIRQELGARTLGRCEHGALAAYCTFGCANEG